MLAKDWQFGMYTK